MEKEKKVKLSTIIIIVVLLITILAAAIIFKNKSDNVNQVEDNTQTINPGVIGEYKITDKSDLIMNFLKLENQKKNMIYSPYLSNMHYDL